LVKRRLPKAYSLVEQAGVYFGVCLIGKARRWCLTLVLQLPRI